MRTRPHDIFKENGTKEAFIISGVELAEGDTLRLYPESTTAKNPRPILETITKIYQGKDRWGGKNMMVSTEKGNTYTVNLTSSESEPPFSRIYDMVSFSTKNHKSFLPFRTQKDYENYRALTQELPLLSKICDATTQLSSEDKKALFSHLSKVFENLAQQA